MNRPAGSSPGSANRQTALQQPCGRLYPLGPVSETGLGRGVRAEQGDDARAEEPRMLPAKMAPQMAETGHTRPPAHLTKLCVLAPPRPVGLFRAGHGETHQARAPCPNPIDRAE